MTAPRSLFSAPEVAPVGGEGLATPPALVPWRVGAPNEGQPVSTAGAGWLTPAGDILPVPTPTPTGPQDSHPPASAPSNPGTQDGGSPPPSQRG